MKKWILFFVVVLALVLFFHWQTDANQIAPKDLEFSANENGSVRANPIGAHETSIVSQNEAYENLPEVDLNEIFSRNRGIHYRSIEEIDYDHTLMKMLREALHNFKQFGSTSGGKVTTEFANAESLKESLSQKGEHAILHGIAINPVQLANILGPSFQLVGANDQAKFIPNLGWSGYVQFLSDATNNRHVELSEEQLETELGDGADSIIEFNNALVGNTPAFLQMVKDENGYSVHSMEWHDGERVFILATKNFVESSVVSLAKQIQDSYRMLPHGGWKTPYRLDPSNPLHRLAIQRNQQELRQPTR